MWALENLEPGLEGLSMAIFTRGLGWSKQETDIFLASVRKDMRDTKIHSYWQMYAPDLSNFASRLHARRYNVTGQKPL